MITTLWRPVGPAELQQVGGRTILEYWIPAEDLDDLNAHIVGAIRLVESFPGV